MKFIIIIIFILFSNSLFANEDDNSEVEVIDLYETRSLDQMVLDNLNEEEVTEIVENSKSIDEIDNNDVDVKQIEIVKGNFTDKIELNDLKNYFENLQKINSKTLLNELIEELENSQLNIEVQKDKEIFFLIINYFQTIGQINKSYELIETYKFNDDKNLSLYSEIKLNYLLSTFQLNEACYFKDELNSKIKLDSFFLEKLDIFCLILNDNLSEASLLNSILIE